MGKTKTEHEVKLGTTNGLARLAFGVFSTLFSITLLSGLMLIHTTNSASADNPASANASVFVSAACTLSGGNNNYSDTMSNSETKTFGPSTIKAICNDASGFALYAIGYSGDTYTGGNNDKMLGNYASINTNTAETAEGHSYWAMQLNAVSGTYTPTIENSFDSSSFHIVPSSFTKVATLTSATDQGPSATGSSVNAYYKVSVSAAQEADTYTGKVKYVLLHPNTAVTGTYDVNYLANGGTGTMASQTNLYNFEDQTLSSISSGSITAPTGYKFIGWCSEQEGTPTSTNPQTTCPGSFFADGATIPASTVGTTPTRSLATTTTLNLYAVYAHYSDLPLVNSNATVIGSTSTSATRGKASVDTPITNPERVYTISGLTNNGIGGENAEVTFPGSGPCTSTTNCSYPYTFLGWYTATTEGTKVINPDGTFTALNGYTDNNAKWHSDATPTLYANWDNTSTPTITLPTITKTGYTCGWATSSDTTTRTYSSGQTGLTLTANTTLYGTCTADNYTQTIKYRYENADGSFTNYTEVTTDAPYDSTFSWSTSDITGFDSTTYQATSITPYTVTGAKTTEVDILRNTFTCKISYQYQNADGTYASPTVAVNTTARYGSSCSWSTNEIPNFDSATYQANNYTNDNVTTNIDTTLNIDRNTITCNKQYRLENADGTWGDYTTDGSTATLYGSSCSYTKQITDYKNAVDATNDSEASTSATNVTSTQTLSLSLYRNTYQLTVNRNTTALASAEATTTPVSGSNLYRWGQAVAITNTANTGYHFTTWSQTAGTVSSFDSATTATTTFTMPKSNATIYADGTANTYTITLNKNGGTNTPTASTTATYNTTTLGTIATLPIRSYGVTGFTNTSSGTNSSISSTSPLAANYTFNGWYKESAATNKIASSDATPALQPSTSYTNASSQWTSTSDQTLYASWTSQSVTLPTITRTGSTCGWATSSSATAWDYTSGASLTPTANTVLYGVCRNDITLDLNGGTGGSTSTTATYGSTTLGSITTPTKSNSTYSVYIHFNKPYTNLSYYTQVSIKHCTFNKLFFFLIPNFSRIIIFSH